MRRAWPALGSSATKKKDIYIYIVSFVTLSYFFCSIIINHKVPTSTAASVSARYGHVTTSIQTLGIAWGLTKSAWNSPWLCKERCECIADMDGRERSEVGKEQRTFYIVSGRERRTFSNLAEFITPLDRFTLPYCTFIPVSPPCSLLQKISLTYSYNEILLSSPTFLWVRKFLK